MDDEARSVLITGASAGIGWSCAEVLHAAGWAVTGTSRRGAAPAGCTGLAMDVDDDESVRAGVAAVLAERGRIDALVAAAGWGLAGAGRTWNCSPGTRNRASCGAPPRATPMRPARRPRGGGAPTTRRSACSVTR